MSVAVNAFAYPEPGKIPSIVLAVAVHVLLAVFLFVGVRWQSREPEAVMVELWDSPPDAVVERIVPEAEPQPKPEVKPEPRVEKVVEPPKPVTVPEKKLELKKEPPKQETPKKLAEVKPEPKVEKAAAPTKPDIALEKKKEVKKEPPKQEEPKKPAEVKPQPKVENAVEPPKPATAPEKKAEVKKEPPKQEEPEPKLDLDRSEDIQAQLERETAALEEQLEKNRILEQMRREAAIIAARADAAYIGRLKAKIKSNIVLPLDIRGNPEAIFDVVQLPTGEVMSVKLRKSSGHKAYDDAVERAIWKGSPLPKPDRPEQFQRNLAITFRPLD